MRELAAMERLIDLWGLRGLTAEQAARLRKIAAACDSGRLTRYDAETCIIEIGWELIDSRDPRDAP
jgi:hypothetical protein